MQRFPGCSAATAGFLRLEHGDIRQVFLLVSALAAPQDDRTVFGMLVKQLQIS